MFNKRKNYLIIYDYLSIENYTYKLKIIFYFLMIKEYIRTVPSCGTVLLYIMRIYFKIKII